MGFKLKKTQSYIGIIVAVLGIIPVTIGLHLCLMLDSYCVLSWNTLIVPLK